MVSLPYLCLRAYVCSVIQIPVFIDQLMCCDLTATALINVARDETSSVLPFSNTQCRTVSSAQRVTVLSQGNIQTH